MTAIVASQSSTEAEAEELRLRQDMAAVFRIAARLGWNEQIGNHNSLMLPARARGDRPTFLINPRGMLFQELTASSLIVCDLDGKVLRGTGELRKVAFHIHARIHLRNPAATCVVHVHPRYLTALSMLKEPEVTLSHHNNLMLNDRIAIDDAGVAPADSHAEGDRLAAALGDRSILLMGGHGVTVVGPTVHDAFDECFIAEGPPCTRSRRCRPGGRSGNCRTGCAAAGPARGATASTPACIWAPGVACWTGRSPTTRPDGGLLTGGDNYFG